MKKITLIGCLFAALTATSQQLIVNNNTSEVIRLNEIWINDFCAYNPPTVDPKEDIIATPGITPVTTMVGPFSGAVVADLTIWTSSTLTPTYDYEYVKLDVLDISSGLTSVLVAPQNLGTDATVIYEPASCQPPVPPVTIPFPTGVTVVVGPGGPVAWLSGTFASTSSIALGLLNGIRQVILPAASNPIAPTATSALGTNGKIYRFLWQTVFNTVTGKYDVEITIN